jgi:hypothetical protein
MLMVYEIEISGNILVARTQRKKNSCTGSEKEFRGW